MKLLSDEEKVMLALTNKIDEVKALGFLSFSLLKGKALKIKDYKSNLIKQHFWFLLESKYGEEYEYIEAFSNTEKFLSYFSPLPLPYQIVCEVNKEITKEFNGLILGVTSEYEKFVVVRPVKSTNLSTVKNFIYLLNFVGNVVPIIVIKKDGLYYIIDGDVRFDILKKQNQDIFYLDITSLVNIYISSKLIFELKVKLNWKKKGVKLVNVWEELCKNYFDYRQLNIFIRVNKVEDYINKTDFVLLFNNQWEDIIDGKAQFLEVEEKFELIKNLYKLFSKSSTFLNKKGQLLKPHTLLKVYKFLKNNYSDLIIEEKFKRYQGKLLYGDLINYFESVTTLFIPVDKIKPVNIFYTTTENEAKNIGENVITITGKASDIQTFLDTVNCTSL